MYDNTQINNEELKNSGKESYISISTVAADEKTIGKVCPFCKTEIQNGDEVIVCPACGIPHHKGCWDEKKGCTTFGCKEHYYESQGTNPIDVCQNCGATLGDGQDFCPKCGTPKSSVKNNVCGKCGAELQDGQEFCPKCGQKVGLVVDTGVATKIERLNNATKKKKNYMPLIASLVAVFVVVVIIIAVLLPGGGVGFQKIYDEYCKSAWAEVGSDGSYLSIDTNPYDRDDGGIAYPEAYTAIKNVNKALGLPDSLISKMGQTSWVDREKSDTFDKIVVTWKYHPDKGLEVTYKKAD